AAEVAGAGAGLLAVAAAGAGAIEAGLASPAALMTATTLFTGTVSPSFARISATTPDAGDGISASTLSVEISNSGSSRSIASPTFLIHRTIVPSAIDSPICGITTSAIDASCHFGLWIADFGLTIAIRNPIRNPQSEIRNLKSEITNVLPRHVSHGQLLQWPPPSSDARESFESAIRPSLPGSAPP